MLIDSRITLYYSIHVMYFSVQHLLKSMDLLVNLLFRQVGAVALSSTQIVISVFILL